MHRITVAITDIRRMVMVVMGDIRHMVTVGTDHTRDTAMVRIN